MATQTKAARIKDVSELEAQAFCVEYSSYDFSVSEWEFNYYDGLAPGHYSGIETSKAIAERYSQGLELCKSGNHSPLSIEGLQLRLKAAKVKANAAYRQLLSDARQKVAKQAELKQKRRDYENFLSGYTRVGCDDVAFQAMENKDQLTVVFEGDVPGGLGELSEDRQTFHQIYALGKDGLIDYWGHGSVQRYTKNKELIQDLAKRREIKGYVYAEPLRTAIAEAERLDALSIGCATWMGGTHGLNSFQETGINLTYAETPSYANEKIERLRKWLPQCIELQQTRKAFRSDPSFQPYYRRDPGPSYDDLINVIEAIIPMVVDGCIVEWKGEANA
jgi:hypothetical protein